MSAQLPIHWQVMQDMSPELSAKAASWRSHLTEDQTIPRKYKELMMVAMACTLRFTAGIRTHAEYAMANGATKEELFATIAQTMTIGGIPAYREGIVTVKDLLQEK